MIRTVRTIHTPWSIITILCAGLLACGDDTGGPQEPQDATSTGVAGITVTTTTTGDVTTTTDTDLVTGTTTGPGDATTGGDTGAATSTGLDTSTGFDPSTGSDTSTGAEPSTGEIPGASACLGKIWACGDGIDNDGDGKIDNADFECISPCDDNEGSFKTDLPGMAEDCKNDCYWDLDSGAGQDKCEYNLQCDAENPGGQIGCGFAEECPASTPQQCLDACVPLIPNGCDCFGCCHIDTPDGIQDYYLDSGEACALDNLAACNKCTFQEQCANPCEGCEVCFGQAEPPEGCDPDLGGTCDEGVQPCTMGGNDCGENAFCQTGCCQALVPG